MRRYMAVIVVAMVAAMGIAGSASAQHEAGDSLVNVQIGDVTILVPVSVAANLCDVNLNVLAEQRRTGGATCEATAESIASPGRGEAGGGGHQAGNSLVNVQVGDITVLLPLAVAANVCDVNVNVLAQQLRQGGASCDAQAVSTA
jgi:hypothetical protein